eukprot:3082878-Prymnesium_polylepis.1
MSEPAGPELPQLPEGSAGQLAAAGGLALATLLLGAGAANADALTAGLSVDPMMALDPRSFQPVTRAEALLRTCGAPLPSRLTASGLTVRAPAARPHAVWAPTLRRAICPVARRCRCARRPTASTALRKAQSRAWSAPRRSRSTRR